MNRQSAPGRLLLASVAIGVLVLAVLNPNEATELSGVPAPTSDKVSEPGLSDRTTGRPVATRRSERCAPPEVRPTYLPWLKPGEEVPPPRETYDEAIDRAQLTWEDPKSGAGVGLTVYPVPGGVDGAGGPTDIELYGVQGRLHRLDEGGLVGINWTLPRRCNFLELNLNVPGLPLSAEVEQLMKIARSLR